MTDRPLTGRKVLVITVTAFAVIIAVNLTLAFKAVSTFPGLETRNSYVASQIFEAERAAQIALGWTVTAELSGDILVVVFSDADARAISPNELRAVIGRPTHLSSDQEVTLHPEGSEYRAPVQLAPGQWALRLSARANDGTRFRQTIALYQRAGRS